jgi:RNA polymerase sigma factor (sigma-70 family)
MQKDSGHTAQNASRLAEIYSREQARFLRFIVRQSYSGEPLDAEEILSDVITHLLERTGLIAGVENLSAYIYRALHNRIIDRRKKHGATVPLDAVDEEGAPLFTPADPFPLPDSLVEQQELAAMIHDAIGRLSPAERAIFIATEIDGRTFAELAGDWEEPLGTLLSRKSRATAKLRKMLADRAPSAPGQHNSTPSQEES